MWQIITQISMKIDSNDIIDDENSTSTDSVTTDDFATSTDNNNITDNTRTRQATSTGDIRFTLYGKEYELNQSDMMLTFLHTFLINIRILWTNFLRIMG